MLIYIYIGEKFMAEDIKTNYIYSKQNVGALAFLLMGTTKGNTDTTLTYDQSYTNISLIPIYDILSFAAYLDEVVNITLTNTNESFRMSTKVTADMDESDVYKPLFGAFKQINLKTQSINQFEVNQASQQIKGLVTKKIQAGQYSEYPLEVLQNYDGLELPPVIGEEYAESLEKTGLRINNIKNWYEIKDAAIDHIRKSYNLALKLEGIDYKFEKEEFESIISDALRSFENKNTKSCLPSAHEDEDAGEHI